MKRLLEWFLFHYFPMLHWRWFVQSDEEDALFAEMEADAAFDNYAMEFLMKGDPEFSEAEARKLVDEMHATNYMCEMEEAFEKLEV